MKERPILFSTPMVQAILQARKTKTRRIVGNGIGFAYSYKQNKRRGAVAIKDLALLSQTDINELIPHCQKGQVGDILWVRETFRPDGLIFTADSRAQFSYKADFFGLGNFKWLLPIHMWKSAARIWLQITDIRVERLQDITLQDIEDEGLPKSFKEASPADWYENLWNKINGPESWESNPWVWVISFKVLSTTGRPATLAHFSSL